MSKSPSISAKKGNKEPPEEVPPPAIAWPPPSVDDLGNINPLSTSLFFGCDNHSNPEPYEEDRSAFLSQFLDFGKAPLINFYESAKDEPGNEDQDDDEQPSSSSLANTKNKAQTSYVNRTLASKIRFRPYKKPVPSTKILQSPIGPRQPTTHNTIVRNPVRRECSAIEQATSTVAGAVSVLSKLPITSNTSLNIESSISAAEFWPKCIEHFKMSLEICSSFAKQLPGYDSLPGKDRSLLLKTAFMPINLSQPTQPIDDKNRDQLESVIFGLNDEARAVMCRQFPPFHDVVKRAGEISLAMKVWDPSFLEFALLQSLLFYQNISANKKFTRPDIVHKMNRLLSVALKCVSDAKISSSSSCQTSSQNVNGKTVSKEVALSRSEKRFHRVYSLLKQSAKFLDELSQAFSDNQPPSTLVITTNDPLYADVFGASSSGENAQK